MQTAVFAEDPQAPGMAVGHRGSAAEANPLTEAGRRVWEGWQGGAVLPFPQQQSDPGLSFLFCTRVSLTSGVQA